MAYHIRREGLYPLLTFAFWQMRNLSTRPSDLDRSVAEKLLVEAWVPDLYLRLYDNPDSFRKALRSLERGGSYKGTIKKLKRFSKRLKRGRRPDLRERI